MWLCMKFLDKPASQFKYNGMLLQYNMWLSLLFESSQLYAVAAFPKVAV